MSKSDFFETRGANPCKGECCGGKGKDKRKAKKEYEDKEWKSEKHVRKGLGESNGFDRSMNRICKSFVTEMVDDSIPEEDYDDTSFEYPIPEEDYEDDTMEIGNEGDDEAESMGRQMDSYESTGSYEDDYNFYSQCVAWAEDYFNGDEAEICNFLCQHVPEEFWEDFDIYDPNENSVSESVQANRHNVGFFRKSLQEAVSQGIIDDQYALEAISESIICD